MELTTTVTIDNENSVARVALAGALNTDTAPDFEKRLVAVVAGGHQLTVLDMKDLDYISSACGLFSRPPSKPRPQGGAWPRPIASRISTRCSRS
jgi:hypothetical protein